MTGKSKDCLVLFRVVNRSSEGESAATINYKELDRHLIKLSPRVEGTFPCVNTVKNRLTNMSLNRRWMEQGVRLRASRMAKEY